MQVEDATITVPDSGLEVAYQRYGSPDAYPILCLHGWQDNCASFQFLAPQLSQYQVIALDFPGHGKSEWIGKGGQYHYIDWLIPLKFMVEAWGFSKVALIGHSMGGGIASLFAACFPESVSYLCMIEAFSPIPHSIDEVENRVRMQYELRKKVIGRKPRTYSSLEEAIQVRMAAGLPFYKAAEAITKRGTMMTDHGLIWRNDPRIKLNSTLGFTLEHVKHMLSLIKSPTDLFVGTEGISLVQQGMKALADEIQFMTVHKIPGSHHCHTENPELIAEVIKKRLSSLA